VLDLKMADFRDPKVFWHEETKRWVMVVALATEKKVHFYTSENLKQWKYVGEFGGVGATNGLWECPDLFPLAIEGGGTKWVLIVNINPGGPAGGSGTQYFVGDFDGVHFTAENKDTLWADYGADFYAGVSWSDVPKADGRRVWLGWMSNWNYAQDIPTSPWRSAMSVPRELTLRHTPEGLRLVQKPAAELEKLRSAEPRKFPGDTLDAADKWMVEQKNLPPLFDAEMAFGGITATTSLTIVLSTAGREETTITIDGGRSRIIVDRTRSGRTEFHRAFPARHEAPLRIVQGQCTLRLVLDASSLEIFAQNGETVLTELIFPVPGPRTLRTRSTGPTPIVGPITVHALKPARKMP
jgi:fructan beta-fructosidase